MHQRRRAREVALQVLYSLDIQNGDPAVAIELFWDNFEAKVESREYSSHLITGAWECRENFDRMIAASSEHWSLTRMNRVDLSILRLALYELYHCPSIPPKVAIDEAVELGRLYGAENSTSFINGILDAIYFRMQADHEGLVKRPDASPP